MADPVKVGEVVRSVLDGLDDEIADYIISMVAEDPLQEVSDCNSGSLWQ